MAVEVQSCDGEEEDQLNHLSLGSFENERMIESNILRAQNEGTEVKSWLDWCRAHKSVICKEYDVPSGILPKGYNAVLIDVKVGATGKKRAPDDKIYLAHPKLRQKVARGNCVLELHKIEKGKIASTQYIFLIFALKKFSGGLGDEDDSNYAQSQWMHYFNKSIDTTKKVICTEKANGEAAHISVWKLLNETFYCIGSKNVHMLLKDIDDVTKYKEPRFDFARRIANAFFTTYILNPEISEDKKKCLIEFMLDNGLTAVAEIIQPDNQHVVNLSHLKHSELRFICWTKPDLSNDFNGSLCSLPIHKAIDKARDFGLQTIQYEVIEIIEDPTTEVEKYIPTIRQDYGHEGKVLYFLDSDDVTIGLIKKKTAWYILLRALREKVATLDPKKLEEKLKNIRKRINEIQTWLELTDELTKEWIALAFGFTKWLAAKRSTANIRTNFPVIFNDYLMENVEVNQKYTELLRKFKAKPSLS